MKRSTDFFCTGREVVCAAPPPVGRAREIRRLIQGSSPKTCFETIFGGEGGCWRGKWGGLFLGYLLGKNFRAAWSKPVKLRTSVCFSGLPPESGPPDLRTSPAASSSRTPPSRPRASARSRASACGPHGAGREKPKTIQNNSGLPQGFAGPCAVG